MVHGKLGMHVLTEAFFDWVVSNRSNELKKTFLEQIIIQKTVKQNNHVKLKTASSLRRHVVFNVNKVDLTQYLTLKIFVHALKNNCLYSHTRFRVSSRT